MRPKIQKVAHSFQGVPSPYAFGVSDSRNIWMTLIKSEKEHDCFKICASQSIKALKQCEYSLFDAHTTSNCCHGLTLIVSKLLTTTQKYDLETISTDLNHIPSEILDLTSLFILTYCTDFQSNKGRISKPRKLKEISEVSNKFSDKIVAELQRHFSNTVAEAYYKIGIAMPGNVHILNTPANEWAQYLHPKNIRKDRRGVLYASCVYSMQIVLTQQSLTGAYIAIIHDKCDEHWKRVHSDVYVFQGDLKGGFKEVKNVSGLRKDIPVSVYGGCSQSDSRSNDFEHALQDLSKLVLSCDVHYPQFPQVGDDPSFNNTPIAPKEAKIKQLFSDALLEGGRSQNAPYFFCLTHIFPMSVKQIDFLIRHDDYSMFTCASRIFKEFTYQCI